MIRLGEIAAVYSGIAPSKDSSGSSRFVQIRDLSDYRRDLVRGARPTAGRATPIGIGDVLLAARGERIHVVRADYSLVGAFAALDLYLIRPQPTLLDPDYLVVCLSLGPAGSALMSAATEGPLPRIPKSALESLPLQLPALAEQRAIGGLNCTRLHYENLMEQRMDAERRLLVGITRAAFHPQDRS